MNSKERRKIVLTAKTKLLSINRLGLDTKMYEQVIDEAIEEVINFTHCCKSDSELFKPFKEAKGMCKKCLRYWCICSKKED